MRLDKHNVRKLDLVGCWSPSTGKNNGYRDEKNLLKKITIKFLFIIFGHIVGILCCSMRCILNLLWNVIDFLNKGTKVKYHALLMYFSFKWPLVRIYSKKHDSRLDRQQSNSEINTASSSSELHSQRKSSCWSILSRKMVKELNYLARIALGLEVILRTTLWKDSRQFVL